MSTVRQAQPSAAISRARRVLRLRAAPAVQEQHARNARVGNDQRAGDGTRADGDVDDLVKDRHAGDAG
jgi:hypothetical protein